MKTVTKTDKVEHVLAAKQTRRHHCHWPGCDKQVAPALWGCRKHWFMLPRKLRDKIWATYQPGQEERLDPSPSYLSVAREVQKWIKSRNNKVDKSRYDSTGGK